MLGQSAPSASSQMTQKWEEWLICQRVVLPCQGTKLNMCQECVLAAKTDSSILVYVRRNGASSSREVILQLFSVLCPVLVSPEQERDGAIGATPAKGHKGD